MSSSARAFAPIACTPSASRTPSSSATPFRAPQAFPTSGGPSSHSSCRALTVRAMYDDVSQGTFLPPASPSSPTPTPASSSPSSGITYDNVTDIAFGHPPDPTQSLSISTTNDFHDLHDNLISTTSSSDPDLGVGDGGNGGGRGGFWNNNHHHGGRGEPWRPLQMVGSMLAGAGGFFACRARADPNFWFTMLAECGNDAVIILCVNAMARKRRFFKELEFVLCHLTVSLLCDVALVSMLAPTLPPGAMAPATPVNSQRGLARLISTLPANVFEPSNVWEKAGCLVWKGVLYGLVGASMGFLGTAAVHRMTDLKEVLDPSFVPPKMMQDAVLTSVGWFFFMGVSSNIRYQFLAGAEKFLYLQPYLPSAATMGASIAMRFANNVYGSGQWLSIAKALGVSQRREVLKQQSYADSLHILRRRYENRRIKKMQAKKGKARAALYAAA